MPTIPYIALFRRHSSRILLAALLFWLLLGFFVYGAELIANRYFGMKALDLIEQRQYLLRWLLWLLLTPAIVLLALKINIGNCRLFWFILLHIFFGTAILALEFMVELAIIKPMAEAFYHRKVVLGELMIPFLQKYFAYIINYFLIVGMVNMYIYLHSLQTTQKELLQTELQNKELKYRLTLAQLQTLKMQIQPHFLFNAHQSITGLILSKENDKAVRMLSALSDLLRLSLEQQERELVPLEEELRIADLYLSLQQTRFGERLIYSKQIAPDAAAISVPYFILQPVVENAVIHGVEQTDEPAEIRISATLAESRLRLAVSNTGELDPGRPAKGHGIGQSNVSERLKQYFGEQATYRLYNEGNGTTIAELMIPLV
ncbi:sensor histidine kinase [Taibaiella koreensis]|uniref:sensor histidine kinase n=1 Tax=Taibaiella koreensis TaxID=1268548 RepID=UPI000E59EEAE|nr:histidine kinase [Taibaiella koreensis]